MWFIIVQFTQMLDMSSKLWKTLIFDVIITLRLLHWSFALSDTLTVNNAHLCAFQVWQHMSCPPATTSKGSGAAMAHASPGWRCVMAVLTVRRARMNASVVSVVFLCALVSVLFCELKCSLSHKDETAHQIYTCYFTFFFFSLSLVSFWGYLHRCARV